MYIIKITTSGIVSAIPCDMSLQGIRDIVGCSIVEAIALTGYVENGWVMLLDDSGKLLGKAINPLATDIFRFYIGGYDFIVGDVALVLFDGIDDWIGFDTLESAIKSYNKKFSRFSI